MRVQLRDLCGTRSGDKGDIANVALFAYSREVYDALVAEVTAARVKAHFGDMVKGDERVVDSIPASRIQLKSPWRR